MRILLIFLCTLLVATAHGEVYKWVDPGGRVTYSDRPQEGAERVPMGGVASGGSAGRTQDAAPKRRRTASAKDYESFRILTPADGSTLDLNEGTVAISLLLTPRLSGEHSIRVVVNGQEQPELVRTTQIVLSNLSPGTHTISALVLDPAGKKVIAARSVVFHLQDMHSASTTRTGPPAG